MLDQTRNTVSDKEQALSELSERMLIGVACKFGKNSDEYQMAGGVRRRDRKRVTRKVNSPIPT
jgi:hypothetical protein